jgi:hypothetical protein
MQFRSGKQEQICQNQLCKIYPDYDNGVVGVQNKNWASKEEERCNYGNNINDA